MHSKMLKIVSFSVLVLMALAMIGCSSATTEASMPTQDPNVAHPSNPGGAGEAVKLTGDATAGAKVYADNCVKCHGEAGVGGVDNAGSTDGTVPELAPIDETLNGSDAQANKIAIDLFIEHGSTPEGTNPAKVMDAFGDKKTLSSQQIADVIAYVVSLNKK